MNMCIIMTMNIYITTDNEKWLREQTQSMSGIVNELIQHVREQESGEHPLVSNGTPEPINVPTPRVDVYAASKIDQYTKTPQTVSLRPKELVPAPIPGHPHRYYHTEWEEYVKWTKEGGIENA